MREATAIGVRMQRSFRVPKLDIPNRAGYEQLASLHSGVSAAVHAVSSQHRNADTTPADDASPVVAGVCVQRRFCISFEPLHV